MTEPIDFVLASASPRRRELCSAAGYRFVVRASDLPEPPTRDFIDPVAYAVHTAWLKGNAVQRPTDPLVVAADTIVALGQEIIGKPCDRDDARRIIERLMGKSQLVITGVCLVIPALEVSLVDHVVSTVSMKSLTDDQLDRYLASGRWEGKAGAYGIQDDGDPFVRIESGSVSNVVGLPMERLAELIDRAHRLS